MTGAAQVTVTVALLLSAEPQEFVTRTQYCVVEPGLTARFALVPYCTGLKVLPLRPTYHWYERVAVPLATTPSCATLPKVIDVLCGCVVTCGALHATGFTVIVAALLSALPQELVTCTKYVVVVVGDTR